MLLEGIFSHVKNPEDPVITARREMKITYPHPDASPQQQAVERKAQIFEGLARSFLIASVMIHEEPELEICGISLREYYKKHILLSCTEKNHPEYVGTYEEMQEMAKKAGIVYSTMIRQFEANNMTIDNVKKIRETLNLSREELIAIFFGE